MMKLLSYAAPALRTYQMTNARAYTNPTIASTKRSTPLAFVLHKGCA